MDGRQSRWMAPEEEIESEIGEDWDETTRGRKATRGTWSESTWRVVRGEKPFPLETAVSSSANKQAEGESGESGEKEEPSSSSNTASESAASPTTSSEAR